MSRDVAAILLAAGSASRFGGAKLLAPLRAAAHGVPGGTPIGVAACRHLLAALPAVVAVVRERDAALAARLRDAGAQTIECARAHEGMGVTLAAGVAATANAAGWIVALADMPWIAPDTIVAVAARLRDGASIVAPRYAGRRGHPVGFSAQHRAALLALTGDDGADGWIVALGDMPAVAPATIAQVAATFRARGGVVVPTYHGRDGHPVAFASSFRAGLVALSGDRGARRVIDAAGAAVQRVEVDDPGVLHDVDRREDLAGTAPGAAVRDH